MTNKEKFIEVFGEEPHRQYATKSWWEQEYIPPTLDVKPVIKGKWIPVSERLPENNGRYLAYIINKHDYKLQYSMTCDYVKDGHWFPDDECSSDDVIVWMPLPEPYKEERG